jgi:GDP-4-dehydro-6-deoxy-D-mannose reductase
MKDRVLIAGSNGFVGRYLKREFNEDDNIFYTDVIKKDDDNYIACDITKSEQVDDCIQRVKPDVILYLTSQSSVKRSFENPLKTFNINVEGLINTLEAIKKWNIHPYFIFISTIEVYKKSNAKINERTPYLCENPYAISKATGEYLINLYKKLKIIDGIIVQPVAHIGPGQSKEFSISSFAYQLAQLEKDDKNELFVGNLDIVRDIVDVRDVVKFYKFLVTNQPKEFKKIILASGKEYNYQNIIEQLISLSKRKNIKTVTDKKRLRTIDIKYLVASPAYTMSKLGWRPEIPIEKTLSDILNYWREHI